MRVARGDAEGDLAQLDGIGGLWTYDHPNRLL